MKQDRFLTAILMGIIFIVILALVVFFVRREEQGYISEETPEGVVHNYVYALSTGDYEKAHGYIYQQNGSPSYGSFLSFATDFQSQFGRTGIQIHSSKIAGSEAYVEVYIIYSSTGPFDSGWRDTGTANLLLQDGQWKIILMPYPYFNWDWNSDSVKPSVRPSGSFRYAVE